MRSVYLYDHDGPPSEGDQIAATTAGAGEIIRGIPPQLAKLGISTLGYHQIDDTPPVEVPQIIEMRKAKLQMLATPWPSEAEPGRVLLDVVEATVATSRALQIEFGGGQLSRTRDLVLGLQAQFGISDALMDALFIAADARP